ncbi:TPA: restriction endonuclease subunit S [Vibrio parahaemolyticus]|uniref:restriction endonuclease subunit S n=1 Tax=Vibrio parahaemolyticus TaxID=670 RepID=UPI000944FF59|nr:restriction endonuclease subunit S [Vibrio parahaemolyticus]MBE3889691.1 restriction endonuclease subunit S [Vibrio parahaemolyticus]MDG2676990.1 restriction endonuclease subunit S [Vibrio parahaemolyticus]OKY31655.1 hypothetical protein BTU71_05680 [Vibrio parahaemolyticus]HCG9608302.1 restriction endonuclease subunit S [Vibrio parahaemolyticus]HCG9618709.1 restriction endonuclease subunit S [Vibrio parahaemolyticus]
MSYKWPLVKLDNIKAHTKYSCVGGPFGSSLSRKHYTEEGVPVLRGVNLGSDQFFDSDFVYVSKEKAAELHRNMAYPNDVVFTQRGTLGQVAIIPKNARYSSYVVSQSQMKLTVNSEIAHPYYIYSFFRTDKAKQQIETHAIVGGVPHINLGILKALEIPLPPLNIQKKIVNIIRSIDQKITLNTQTNQTLEQMAQAIFKSWFVDFDPVKAKMNGEQPEGMDEATASLFPEKLVESELGLIPEGWEVGELSKLFELHRGFDLPKSKRQDGEYPVYAAGGFHGTHSEYKMEPPGIITGRSGVIGNVYLSLDKYWPLNTTLYVREFRICGPYYAYHLLRSLDLKSLNSGSAVPSLNRNFVHSTNVCHPDSNVLAKFEEIVTPLFEKMVANNEQNKSLSELHDTLLPKLLSGEIELGQAQELAEVE